MTQAATSQQLPLGKSLGSNEKSIRDEAVMQLRSYMAAPTAAGDIPLSSLESQKLWKGIFYCYWMSDKPLIQQALASDLASILIDIQPHKFSDEVLDPSMGNQQIDPRLRSVLSFLQGFWQSILREWINIDHHRSAAHSQAPRDTHDHCAEAIVRLDKYYNLMRQFIYSTFAAICQIGWTIDTMKQYNQLMTSNVGPLSNLPGVPIGVRNYFVSNYLVELDKAVLQMDGKAQCDASKALLLEMLQPFAARCARAKDNITYNRFFDGIFEPLLRGWRDILDRQSEGMEMDEDLPTNESSCPSLLTLSGLTRAQARKEVLKLLFEQASAPEAANGPRKKLYSLYRAEEDD